MALLITHTEGGYMRGLAERGLRMQALAVFVRHQEGLWRC
jgi:hypothetical protein